MVCKSFISLFILSCRDKLMKLRIVTTAVLLSLALAQPTHAADAPLSPLMKQLNNGNWLAEQEAQSLSDELYYQDAIQAYIQTLTR